MSEKQSVKRKCPVHGIPDCSPLLNGCSRLINPIRSVIRDCSDCEQGKHQNCTGEAWGTIKHLRCPCSAIDHWPWVKR